MSKKITLDLLAEQMRASFEAQAEKVDKLNAKTDAVETRLSESIRDLNINLKLSMGRFEERMLHELDSKISFILTYGVTQQQLRALVFQLKEAGLDLNEAKIFEF